MKDFLPYKSYRVLDTQWVAGSQGATMRLQGLDNQEYDVNITADEVLPMVAKAMGLDARVQAGTLNIVFKLQEVGAGGSPNFGDAAGRNEEMARTAAAADLDRQRVSIEGAVTSAREQGQPQSLVQKYEAQIADIKKHSPSCALEGLLIHASK